MGKRFSCEQEKKHTRIYWEVLLCNKCTNLCKWGHTLNAVWWIGHKLVIVFAKIHDGAFVINHLFIHGYYIQRLQPTKIIDDGQKTLSRRRAHIILRTMNRIGVLFSLQRKFEPFTTQVFKNLIMHAVEQQSFKPEHTTDNCFYQSINKLNDDTLEGEIIAWVHKIAYSRTENGCCVILTDKTVTANIEGQKF